MKLHFFPVSTASRPVLLFLAEEKIPYEPVIVDMMTGAHLQAPFTAINPFKQVPVLEDGDFVLTESSAILKYLADKHDAAAYPKDLKARARVNERMDWCNTNHYREWGYHLVYPQIFPHHKRKTDEAQQSTIEWGRDARRAVARLMNDYVIGDKKYLCGDQITIADYFRIRGACGRRSHRRQHQALPERGPLDEHDARAAGLEEDERGDRRLRRVAQGPEVRHDPVK